ncbi:hypothetical protein JOE44_000354 [Chryseobacterium sp. PvR013]|nr:hypothetical protein [Chryseobacterium sp. PvR013]
MFSVGTLWYFMTLFGNYGSYEGGQIDLKLHYG